MPSATNALPSSSSSSSSSSSTQPQPQQQPPSAPPSQETRDSPTPPPPLPTPLTPGPRATAFLNLYSSALDSTLKSISYTSFSSCFPTISIQADAALRGMHKGMVERLDGFAREEFEMILKEREVVERLNGLEGVIAQAKSRRSRVVDGEAGSENEPPIPPHQLPIPVLLSSHLAPLHRSQQSQLNAKLQTTQSQNASLIEEIRQQKEEIEALLRQVESSVGDVSGAGSKLGEKVAGLSSEGRGAREVLGGLES